MRQLSLVDLFAGAGGLSLGLEAAGFRRTLAVERSPMAAETYFRNFLDRTPSAWELHRSAPHHDQAAAGLAVASTDELLGNFDAVERALGGTKPDLIAGGPPCQGFSLAGLRNPKDQRNQLPFQFLEFVQRLQPRLVLIENVPGMAMAFGESVAPLQQLAIALRVLGYRPQVLNVDASHFGVPQRRPRTMLVGVARSMLPIGFDVGAADDPVSVWTSGSRDAEPWCTPGANQSDTLVTCGEAFADITDDGYRASSDGAASTYAQAMRSGTYFKGLARPEREPEFLPNHNLRKHGPRVRARFALYRSLAPYALPRNPFVTATDVDSPIEAAKLVLNLLKRGGVSDPIEVHDRDAIREVTGVDAAAGLRELSAAIASLGSRKHSQQVLRPDLPSPTMLSLPDDFVHFASSRTLSVREMARLQSFPDDFVFYSRETTGSKRRRSEVPQYTQVGNAVPPILAKAVGTMLVDLLFETPDRPRNIDPSTRLQPNEDPGSQGVLAT